MRLRKAGMAGLVLAGAGALIALISSTGQHQSVTGRGEGLLLLIAGALFVLGDVLIR